MRPKRVEKRNRIILSCTECHRRKQKCNRSLPCNDCLERRMPHKCRYEIPDDAFSTNHHGNSSRWRRPISSVTIIQEFSAESVAGLAHMQPSQTWHSQLTLNPEALSSFQRKLLEDARNSIIGLPNRPILKPQSLVNEVDTGNIPPYPGNNSFDPFNVLPHSIQWSRTLQQPLITYFIECLVPWLCQYEEGPSPTPRRLSWLPECIDHPPLFYATLLCAAVHLDRVQQRANPQVAIWLKAETLRLLNETLSNASEGASDRAILVALILLYFNVGGGNPTEYLTHLNGINQMLMVRGGIEALGLRGMVKNWLAICHGPWSEGWQYGRLFQPGDLILE